METAALDTSPSSDSPNGSAHSSEAPVADSTIDVETHAAPTAPSSVPSTVNPRDVAAQRVVGRVIDFWEHPVPNVPVRIGPLQAKTDADGRFELDGVPPTYDVSLAVRILGEITEVYAWHYVGLTRRDPTLQIYKGLTQHTSTLSLEFSGFQSNARWRGEVGLGGIHGQRAYPLGKDVQTVVGWRGPPENVSPLRVLLWNTTEQAPSLPAGYLFTSESSVTLSKTQSGDVTFALPEAVSPLPTFDVSFLTKDAPNTSHLATSYVRFNRGPSIQVAQVPRLSAATEPPFSVKVPQLPDASVTLAALSGNGANSTNFVVTYAPGLTTSSSVEVTFPTVATLEAPDDASLDVTLATPFTWSDTGGTYIAIFDDLAVYQTVYVVTAAPSVTIPDLESLGIYYPRSGPYTWTIESHGTAQTVDELCAGSYLDPFSGDFLYPIGPRAGQGRFWRTPVRTFVFD